MEKKEKTGKFWKSVIWTVVSYIVISVIAGVCSVVRGSMQGDSGATVSWFVIVEFILFPILFFVAGYWLSNKFELGKFKTYKVWLFSVGFSAVLLLLWYFVLEAYVLLNLPVAEGGLALDLFLRKITVVQDYAILYLRETNGYKYVILPLIHFVFRVVYWLLFALGNRKYATEQKERARL